MQRVYKGISLFSLGYAQLPKDTQRDRRPGTGPTSRNPHVVKHDVAHPGLCLALAGVAVKAVVANVVAALAPMLAAVALPNPAILPANPPRLVSREHTTEKHKRCYDV